MNLIISAEFSAPPSDIQAFRTLTLYATVFKSLDCLVEANKPEIDYYYYHWLKDKYGYDFVKQMIYIGEERGLKIRYNIISDRLTFNNLRKFVELI